MTSEDLTPESNRPTLERITVNLVPAASEALAHAAALTRVSRTDTINRSLQAYDFLMDMQAAGVVLLLRYPDSVELERLRLL